MISGTSIYDCSHG